MCEQTLELFIGGVAVEICQLHGGGKPFGSTNMILCISSECKDLIRKCMCLGVIKLIINRAVIYSYNVKKLNGPGRVRPFNCVPLLFLD